MEVSIAPIGNTRHNFLSDYATLADCQEAVREFLNGQATKFRYDLIEAKILAAVWLEKKDKLNTRMASNANKNVQFGNTLPEASAQSDDIERITRQMDNIMWTMREVTFLEGKSADFRYQVALERDRHLESFMIPKVNSDDHLASKR